MVRETRSVPVPSNRMNVLKRVWMGIYKPLVEDMGLEVRMNTRTRCVDIRTGEQTENVDAIQRAEDFVRAFCLGFMVEDAMVLLRMDDLYIDSFEIRDVKALSGDHLSRAIGRLAGREGKTKNAIENSSRTRIVLADSKIHILGTYQNIRVAKDAVVSLILGSPAGKVYSKLRAVNARMREKV